MRNKKSFYRISFLSCAFLLLAVAGFAQEVKVGYTNVELLLNYMPETKAVESQMSTLETKLTEKMRVKQKNYQVELNTYLEKRDANLLSPADDQAAQEKLRKLQTEIEEDYEDAQEQMYTKRMELLQPVQEKMQKAIDEVAAEGGYSYILNQAVGSGVPTILYGVENSNVTEKIAVKLGIQLPKAEGK